MNSISITEKAEMTVKAFENHGGIGLKYKAISLSLMGLDGEARKVNINKDVFFFESSTKAENNVNIGDSIIIPVDILKIINKKNNQEKASCKISINLACIINDTMLSHFEFDI